MDQFQIFFNCPGYTITCVSEQVCQEQAKKATYTAFSILHYTQLQIEISKIF